VVTEAGGGGSDQRLGIVGIEGERLVKLVQGLLILLIAPEELAPQHTRLGNAGLGGQPVLERSLRLLVAPQTAQRARPQGERPRLVGMDPQRRVGRFERLRWALALSEDLRPQQQQLEVARRERELGALADTIAATGRPRPTVLPADLERPEAIEEIGAALQAQGLEPDVVVNNAGFGLYGTFGTLDRAGQRAMIEVNVRALSELSLAFIDSIARHRGGILNVSSIVAYLPGPGMAVYYATKAYVLSFSEALHCELKPRGVRVTALCPGPVPTEFQCPRPHRSCRRRAAPRPRSPPSPFPTAAD
jgi:short-subunit dehydrogenase